MTLLTRRDEQYHRIVRPLDTHWELAPCIDVDCPQFLRGFTVIIDESTGFGKLQGDYLRNRSGRTFKIERGPDGLTHFVYPPGQKCYREHWLPKPRDPLYMYDNPAAGNYNRYVLRPPFRSEEVRVEGRTVLNWQDFRDHQSETNYRLQRGIDRG